MLVLLLSCFTYGSVMALQSVHIHLACPEENERLIMALHLLLLGKLTVHRKGAATIRLQAYEVGHTYFSECHVVILLMVA
jgi:hypothetical protein